MTDTKLPLTGRCHCGVTTYEVSAMPMACVACHCKNCQRTGGGAFSVNIITSGTALTFTGQAPGTVRWTADSGNARVGRFCTSCGSRIANGYEPWDDIIVVRGGTLDDTSVVRPVAHLWLSAKQDWVTVDPEALHYDEGVTDRAAVAKRYAEAMAN